MQLTHEFFEDNPFEVVQPVNQRLPIVFNSPHSGDCYPDAFLAASRLDEQAIRRSQDTFVDELFISAVELGAPLLRANFPRAWLDVNREPYELDAKMFDGELPAFANTGSSRVAGGLGTIARIVSENAEIYLAKLSVEEGLARIDEVYKPYHRALQELVATTHAAFGQALLIDCHSMPSSVRGGHTRMTRDIVLGDRYGASCASDITDIAAQILSRLGYSVGRNKPYAGGFITEHYGQPDIGLHAMQLEINRSLYMDEHTLQPSAGFGALKADLADFVAEFAGMFENYLVIQAEAAE